jgi:hypothetical protein
MELSRLGVTAVRLTPGEELLADRPCLDTSTLLD